MSETTQYRPAERILQQHPERPYLNDPHTRPTLREVLPELQDEPWYQLRWSVVVCAVLSATLMALGVHGVLEAVSTWWRMP